MEAAFKEVVELLKELREDSTVPKNVKIRIENIVNNLSKDIEVSIKVSKALQDLDEIADDANIQPYTRAQIWNIVSILEKI